MEKKIESLIQMVLLVVAVFAFAHLTKEVLGFTSASVVLPDDVRGQFQGTDEELELALDYADSTGLLDGVDLEDPDAVREAVQQIADQYERGGQETSETGVRTDSFSGLFEFFNQLIPLSNSFSKNSVTQRLLDDTGGVYTCPNTTRGEICQEFFGNDCDANCDFEGGCIEKPLKDMADGDACKQVTCYDEEEGTCAEPSAYGGGSPKWKCEADGGQIDDTQCTKGCCVFGEQAELVTRRQCDKRAEDSGLEMGEGIRFEDSIVHEIDCLAEVLEPEVGACVFELDSGEKGCKFVTDKECREMTGDPSSFHKDELCTNPDLNGGVPICEKQAYTGCVDGKDEVYWFDICDNRANIYDASKASDADYWEVVVPKEDLCEIGTGSEPVKNQRWCGNCNHFFDSYCGNETTSAPVQELDDSPDGDVACLDMGCYNEDGNRIRSHGESWCAYHSSIGLPGGIEIPFVTENRATDTPGSTHFRMSCLNGEITATACGPFRGYICGEEQVNKEGGKFSQASCRVNRWQECLEYNPDLMLSKLIGAIGGESAGDIGKGLLDFTCGFDSDCFVKTVDLTQGSSEKATYKFSFCTSKYPPGIDFVDDQEGGEQFCARASNKCTAMYVKEVSGWDCRLNCDCVEGDPDDHKPSDEFVKQMNEFCMSIGDCGKHINYMGVEGQEGYEAWTDDCDIDDDNCGESRGFSGFGGFGFGGANAHAEDKDPSLVNPLDPYGYEYVPARDLTERRDIETINELFVELGLDQLLGGFGGGGGGTDPDDVLDTGGANIASRAMKVGGVVGASGIALSVSGWAMTTGTTGAITHNLVAAVAGAGSGSITGVASALQGIGTAAISTAAATAITGFLIDATGVGAGLDSVTTTALIGVAASAGDTIGLSIAGIGPSPGGLEAACFSPPACIAFAAVVITILLLKFVGGVGEQRKVVASFDCKAWKPPISGNCNDCGKDGMSDGTQEFPCTKYGCEALGSDCKFVSESETPEDGGICIKEDPSDTSAPRIIALGELTDGFVYEPGLTQGVGFGIEKDDDDRCLDAYESVKFEFELDEPGKCKISANPALSYDEMPEVINGFSFRQKHTYTFSSLKLLDMGYEDELDSETKTGIELYIACEDYLNNQEGPPHVVELCVVPKDETAAAIGVLDEDSLEYLREIYQFEVRVNEPVECRWDEDSEKDFDDMENEFFCDNNNLACVADVSIRQAETKICVRCLDRPEWSGTYRAGERNENVESQCTLLHRAEGPLVIDYIVPGDGGIVRRGTFPAYITAEAKTSGGTDGTADCEYSVDGGAMTPMQSTGGMEHKQERINIVTGGEHVLKIRCGDGLHSAEKTSTFSLEIDTASPSMARVYDDSGTLVVITNENAKCAFRTNGCGFLMEEGEEMSGTGLVHSRSFDSEKTYYIKCADEFNHVTSQCLVVSGGVL